MSCVDEVFRVIEQGKCNDTTQGKLRHAGRRFAKLGMLPFHGLGERLLRALRFLRRSMSHVSSQNDSLGLILSGTAKRVLGDVAHLRSRCARPTHRVAFHLRMPACVASRKRSVAWRSR